MKAKEIKRADRSFDYSIEEMTPQQESAWELARAETLASREAGIPVEHYDWMDAGEVEDIS